MKKQSRVVYTNEKQDEFLYAPQKTKVWIGGRGSGKTVNVGDHLYDFIRNLPHLKGFLLGKTFGQVYDKFLPEILDRLKAYGLKEVTDSKTPGHFIVCKQPPKYFKRPHKMPRRYDTSVFFITGFYLELLSFDRPDLSRGGSYDVGIHDEAALIKKDKYNKAIAPLVRGKVSSNDHPQRFTRLFYTSRSWTTWGKWVETDFKRLAAEKPEDYFFMETSALDNVDVLGDEYFNYNKDQMTPYEYDVEILNIAPNGIPNGYYPSLSDDNHLYSVANDYTTNSAGLWVKSKDGDVDPDKPLEPSFDFNNAFTSATIFQDFREELNEFRGVNEFWVKHQSIKDLVDKICDYYKDHPTKIVNIYGGKDGNTSRVLISELDFYGIIVERFKHHRWEAYLGGDFFWSDKQHKIKYELMYDVFKGTDPHLPRVTFNMDNCSFSFRSCKNAPILPGFLKDKSSESDPDLEQEFATHLSDNVDNYVIPKIKGSVLISQASGSMQVGSR